MDSATAKDSGKAGSVGALKCRTGKGDQTCDSHSSTNRHIDGRTGKGSSQNVLPGHSTEEQEAAPRRASLSAPAIGADPPEAGGPACGMMASLGASIAAATTLASGEETGVTAVDEDEWSD